MEIIYKNYGNAKRIVEKCTHSKRMFDKFYYLAVLSNQDKIMDTDRDNDSVWGLPESLVYQLILVFLSKFEAMKGNASFF